MAKEIERSGIPTVVVSALPVIPLTVGAFRVVAGKAVPCLLGDPALPDTAERQLRRGLVELALSSLTRPVEVPTLIGAAG